MYFNSLAVEIDSLLGKNVLVFPEVWFFVQLQFMLVMIVFREWDGYGYKRMLFNLVLVFEVFMIVWAMVFYYEFLSNGDVTFFNALFGVDGMVITLKFVLVSLYLVLLLGFYDSMVQSRVNYYFGLIISMFMLLFVMLLLSSLDIFFMFILLEGMTICFYVLLSLNRSSYIAVEASMRYFILNGVVSVMMLYGFSWLLMSTGSLNLMDINLLITNWWDADLIGKGIKWGLLWIWLGMLFKLGLVPLHFWVVDVYEGSTYVVVGMFIIFPKFVALYLVGFVFFDIILVGVDSYVFMLEIVGIFSMFLGSFYSIFQTQFKRFMGFSAIAQMGFLIGPLSMGIYYGWVVSLYLSFLYFMIVLGFMQILVLCFMKGEENMWCDSIYVLLFISENHGILRWIMAVQVASLIGIPPFLGFVFKMIWFEIMSYGDMYVYVFMGLMISIFSFIYYVRFISFLFFKKVSFGIFVIRRNNVSFVSFMIVLYMIFVNIFYLYLYLQISYFLAFCI